MQKSYFYNNYTPEEKRCYTFSKKYPYFSQKLWILSEKRCHTFSGRLYDIENKSITVSFN